MTSTLEPGRQFGPWALDLEPGERRARLRSLRAIVRLLTGPRGAVLAALLHKAEEDDTALPPAADALDALAPLDMRKVLASYAGLVRPLPPARRPKAHGFRHQLRTVTPLPSRPRESWATRIRVD